MENNKIENETVNTSVLFREWALAYARKRVSNIADDAKVEMVSEVEGEGCCDLCYSVTSYIVLTVGGNRFYLDRYGLFTG